MPLDFISRDMVVCLEQTPYSLFVSWELFVVIETIRLSRSVVCHLDLG